MSLASALRTGQLDQLPGRRDEDWRWTDLRGLIRVAPPASPTVDNVAANPVLQALREPVTTYANGRMIRDDASTAPDAMRLRRFVSASNGTGHSLEASVEVAAGERLLLIDSFEGHASGYVADARFPIRVGEGARLERVVLLDDAVDAVSVSLTEVELAPGAVFHQTVLASGAKRQRFETRVRHHGGKAEVQLDGVYVLAGQRHSDQTTLVEHLQRDGVAVQLTKGVVQDQARGVFQGRIVVHPGADGTDAKMGHHALVLSDRAEVDAKPELEIWADDVACAHGNTVGALDEEALFYARSRGIPEAEARAMLIEAFLAEAADRIEHIQARELAHQWLAAQLRARS
ncbi:MAG TPA: Fe-S cluster assembly protein SufD [Caulobacteraceae bacterium]